MVQRLCNSKSHARRGFQKKTPGGGFEPPTSSLTAKRSATELPGNNIIYGYILYH